MTKPRDVGDIYQDGTYLADNPGWHDEDGAWKADAVDRLFQEAGIRPDTICDIGCGTGRVLEELGARLPEASRLVGYELSPEAVGIGLARQNPRIELRLGDAMSDGEVFDVALMMDVFEHVPDYLGFLCAARGKGRFFVFHIPLDLNVSSALRAVPLIRARASLGHLHYFSRETALATLQDAGYHVRAETITAGAVELPAKTVKRRLAVWPRRATYLVKPALAARLLGGFSLLVLAEAQNSPQA